MRVITGIARGHKLITVAGDELVRPTPERVKEAIFSAIQFDVEGRRVLDLFAGCGQLGIEALSRGAKSAVFVDASDISLNTVKQNVKSCKLEDSARCIRSDAFAFLAKCNDTFDIAFLDPPYQSGILEKAALEVAKLMSDYGVILCEHPLDAPLPDTLLDFKISKEYRFGKIVVTLYRKAGTQT